MIRKLISLISQFYKKLPMLKLIYSLLKKNILTYLNIEIDEFHSSFFDF